MATTVRHACNAEIEENGQNDATTKCGAGGLTDSTRVILILTGPDTTKLFLSKLQLFLDLPAMVMRAVHLIPCDFPLHGILATVAVENVTRGLLVFYTAEVGDELESCGARRCPFSSGS